MIIGIFIFCLIISIVFIVLMIHFKAFKAPKIPEVKEDKNYYKYISFWNPPVEATSDQCTKLYAGSNFEDLKNCCNCYVFDYNGENFPHQNDLVTDNTTILNSYSLSNTQECRTVDQVTSRIGFHTCKQSEGCNSLKGGLKHEEFFSDSCPSVPLCPGVLGSICFGYDVNSVNYALSYSSGFEFRELNTKESAQKFRIVRCSFRKGVPVKISQGSTQGSSLCTGELLQPQGSSQSLNFQFPSLDGEGNWRTDESGYFAYIIHKETGKALVYDSDPKKSTLKLVDKPITEKLEEILVWMLIAPEQVSLPIPGIKNQRCNYVPGTINYVTPKPQGYQFHLDEPDEGENFKGLCFGNIVVDVEYRSLENHCSEYNDNNKNAGSLANFKIKGNGFSPMKNTNLEYYNTAFITKSGTYSTPQEMNSKVKSDYWNFSLVDPSYTIDSGTIMIQDGSLGCSSSYCPEVAYLSVSTDGSKVSSTKPKYETSLGSKFNDGTVTWEVVDAYKLTVLFNPSYFKSLGVPEFSAFAGLNGVSNQTPTKCSQQIAFLSSDELKNYREIFSEGLVKSIFLNSDKNSDRTTTITLKTLQLSERKYVNINISGNLESARETEIKKLNKPDISDLELLPFSPYQSFAVALIDNKPAPGNKSHLFCSSNTEEATYKWYSEFNRTQFIPYGTENSYSKYTNDTLPSF